jgi:hypothetical protein
MGFGIQQAGIEPSFFALEMQCTTTMLLLPPFFTVRDGYAHMRNKVDVLQFACCHTLLQHMDDGEEEGPVFASSGLRLGHQIVVQKY